MRRVESASQSHSDAGSDGIVYDIAIERWPKVLQGVAPVLAILFGLVGVVGLLDGLTRENVVTAVGGLILATVGGLGVWWSRGRDSKLVRYPVVLLDERGIDCRFGRVEWDDVKAFRVEEYVDGPLNYRFDLTPGCSPAPTEQQWAERGVSLRRGRLLRISIGVGGQDPLPAAVRRFCPRIAE